LSNRTIIVLYENGIFDPFLGDPVNIQLVVPYYERRLDWAISPSLGYTFSFNNRFQIGLEGNVDIFPISGDWNRTLQLTAGVAF
jgi:hypothetical protein